MWGSDHISSATNGSAMNVVETLSRPLYHSRTLDLWFCVWGASSSRRGRDEIPSATSSFEMVIEVARCSA